MTPEWVAIITPAEIAVLGWITVYIAKRQERKADEVATVTKKATVQAAEQSKAILHQTDAIHTLVNSQYGIALALILEKAKRIAALSKEPDDQVEVNKAQAKLDEHEARQHVADIKDAL